MVVVVMWQSDGGGVRGLVVMSVALLLLQANRAGRV